MEGPTPSHRADSGPPHVSIGYIPGGPKQSEHGLQGLCNPTYSFIHSLTHHLSGHLPEFFCASATITQLVPELLIQIVTEFLVTGRFLIAVASNLVLIHSNSIVSIWSSGVVVAVAFAYPVIVVLFL